MDDLMKHTKLKLIEVINSLELSMERLRIESSGFKNNWKGQKNETRRCQDNIKLLENKLSRISQSIETVIAMRYSNEGASRPQDMKADVKPENEEFKLLLYLQHQAGSYINYERHSPDKTNMCNDDTLRPY